MSANFDPTRVRRWVTVTGFKKSKNGEIYLTGEYNDRHFRMDVTLVEAQQLRKFMAVFEGSQLPMSKEWIEQ